MLLENVNNTILLTGAGFTHNFGTPLAKEMWALIFNSKKIQTSVKLRSLLLEDFDYESVYYSVINGNYLEEDKKILTEAIIMAYNRIDKIISEWHSSGDDINALNIYGFQDFINRFYKPGKKSFIFSLNQDLLLERLYYNGQKLVMHGLRYQSDLYFSTNFDLALTKNPFIELPDKEEISREDYANDIKNGFYYIKLHGSSNWKRKDGETRIVIGFNKEEQIKEEPILSVYFDIFNSALKIKDVKLLISGYSFSDEHINKIISDSCNSSNLSVYVLSPQNVDQFKKMLLEKKHGKDIWNSIKGYYPYTLKMLFPKDQSDSTFLDLVYENYFN